MSTFLELCNQVNDIIGLQGSISSVTSPKGIQRIIVDAVSSSWVDIQTMREDWEFMNREISSFSTIEDQVMYTPSQVFGGATAAANLGVYLTKRGIWRENVMLSHVAWEDLPFIDNTESGPPTWYSIDPATNNLYFQKPDGAYDLVIRYKKIPQVLSEATHTPSIPYQFERAIVYKAVQKMATYLGNAGLYQNYSVEGNLVLGQMYRHYIRPRRVYPRNFLI